MFLLCVLVLGIRPNANGPIFERFHVKLRINRTILGKKIGNKVTNLCSHSRHENNLQKDKHKMEKSSRHENQDQKDKHQKGEKFSSRE